jgi:UDP-4-amino-4,6-dideoxy-N-acetyl-beta-L-altrosamine transaminase
LPKQQIPYGRQWIDEDDIAAVIEVLRSDWLTTGPKVREFEAAFAALVGANHGVAVSSGTAALHAAIFALGLGPGDEVIVPPMTFAATANCVVFQGAKPVFADVDDDSLLIDPQEVERQITPRTKAIIAVDYAGHPCDYEALAGLAERHGLALVADACHSLGGSYRGRAVGSLAQLTAFSFHPVKHVTTGEGGMITTDEAPLAERLKMFRNHGITSDHWQREQQGAWAYEMVELGYNYRLTDFQCALGMSQLKKLPGWVARRQAIAQRYRDELGNVPGLQILKVSLNVSHAYHLFVMRLKTENPEVHRRQMFAALRQRGIGVNVHYIPVHLHPFYRRRFGTGPGLCPRAEAAYQEIISLPLFPRLKDCEVEEVIAAIQEIMANFSR